MKQLITFFTEQSLFGILLTFFAILIGSLVLSFFIRREVFPNVSFDTVTVTTIFPGASPAESEKLVTNVLEREIKEIDGIKKMESHSVDGRSLIVIQLDPDDTTEEKMKSDLRDIVERAKQSLPDDAEDPLIQSMESKQRPIIEVGLFSKSLRPIEFRDLARKLEEDLESVDGVARVETYGLQDLEIRVETSLAKLSRYYLSLEDLVNALKTQNVSIPGGTIEASFGIHEKSEKDGHQIERIVRTSGQFQNLDDIRNTVVRANDLGKAVKLSDLATVDYELAKPTTLSNTNGKPSIRLQVIKKELSDAIKVTDDIKEKMDALEPSFKDVAGFEYLNDLSFLIKRRLSILTTNLAVGLALVLIILALLLPFKVALIVSIGIPFSFFGTIILFDAFGFSINLISLIGLIIVSGMLVDDAIVIMDNCINHMERGKTPLQAAIDGTYEIWIPVTAAVLTTIVVFLPMMFMSGIFGKFVREIPTGVILALMFSLIEAFFILPGHIAEWVTVTKKDSEALKKKGLFLSFWDSTLVPGYVNSLRFVLKWRYVVGVTVFALFIGSAYVGFKLKLILFPPDDVEAFFIRAQTDTGTSLDETAQKFRPVEEAILALPEGELKNFITTVGMHGQEGADIPRRGSEYVQATVFLTPPNERERGDDVIINELRANIGTPIGLQKVTFQRINPGPPVGKPVSLGIRGETYEDILPAVSAVQKMVEAQKGVTDVDNTYVLGKKEFLVTVDGSEASAANLSVAQVGTTVRAAFEGLIPTSVRTLSEEMDIRVSLSHQERTEAETLKNLKIPNGRGYRIPLTRVASITESQGLADYAHENNERQIKVQAEVDTDITSSNAVNAIFRSQLAELNKQFPNVKVAFGGESKDTVESMISLAKAFVVAIIGVLLLLVLTFRRLVQPLFLIVFVTIPMGIMSVIWAFIIHGRPLTFMGMLGIIALSGVIVNNAIVFIDFVNRRREDGSDRWQSILDSAKARIRPIVLTTITTAAGLIPTTYGIGGLDKFVTYITMALSWGLLFGSLMTAFVLPTAMAILDDVYVFFTGRAVAEPKLKRAVEN